MKIFTAHKTKADLEITKFKKIENQSDDDRMQNIKDIRMAKKRSMIPKENDDEDNEETEDEELQ